MPDQKPPVTWPRASCLLLGVSSIWYLSAPILGHMGRPWPCVFVGLALAGCGFMLYYRPLQRRGWGTLGVLISGTSLFLGSGAIIPAGLGIIGSVTAVVWTPKADGN